MPTPDPGIPFAVRAAAAVQQIIDERVQDFVAFHIAGAIYVFGLTNDFDQEAKSKVTTACKSNSLAFIIHAGNRRNWVTVGNQNAPSADQMQAVKNMIREVETADSAGDEPRWCILPGSIIRASKKKVDGKSRLSVQIAFAIKPNVLLSDAEVGQQATYATQLTALLGRNFCDVVINGIRVEEVSTSPMDHRKVVAACRLPGPYYQFIADAVAVHAKALGFGKFAIEHMVLKNSPGLACPPEIKIGHGNNAILLYIGDGFISVFGPNLKPEKLRELASAITTILSTQ